MNNPCRRVALTLIVACCWAAGSGFGQETGGEETGNGDGDRGAATDTLREQTIYIPYEKLRNKFEKEGRGVFLPYEKFQKLWKAAREAKQPPRRERRPVEALINSIDSEATIEKQVVDVSATLQLEILGEGWTKLPLRLRHSAIRSATINGRPARLVADPSAGHQLLYKKTSEEPEELTLELQYRRKFDKTPGQSSVVFESPRAPINRWRIHVPETGMDVEIDPMIAATRGGGEETETSDEQPSDEQDTSGEHPNDLLAFVGAAPTVRVTWTPKAEGASGLTAFATVKSRQEFVISEGVARSTVTLDYDISRSTLSQLTLEVPSNQKVVNVFDRNVKRWEVKTEEEKQVIQAELFEPVRGKQSLVLELETFRDATESTQEITAPMVKAVGVGRQEGIVVARVETGLQGEAIKRTGLLQMDRSDLPQALGDSDWTFAYRYGAVPYELTLRIEKVLPRISVTELVDAALETDQLSLAWRTLFQIDDAGVFQLRIKIPANFEVRDIEGKALGDAAPAAVDSYHQSEDNPENWTVNLSEKAFGKVGLHVRLRRSLSDPNLLSPTGESSTLSIPLPQVAPSDIEYSQGTLVLSAPTSLRVNPAELQGLRSISFSRAYEKIPAVSRGGQELRPVLSYAYAKGETALSVTAERREPRVTVDQLVRATIDSGVVTFNVSLFCNIKYSGVKSLRVDIPSSLTEQIRVTNKSVRREEIQPQPADLAEDYIAWSLAAENELRGSMRFDLVWEQRIDELGIGKSRDISIPRLIPQAVDLATGQIVIAKAESIDVQPTADVRGLIPIDPHNDLRHPADIENTAMAFTFVDDWSLVVRATRYELEESKLTSIERAVVRMVALSQDELSVQVIYQLRSARQRLAIRLPADAAFDAQPLRINGQSINPERESETTISAPLLEQDMDETFVLELRYTTPGSPSQLDLPSLPSDPAVQKVYLCVYLREKRALLGSWGPWTKEQREASFPWLDVTGGPSERELIQWVTENNPPAAQSVETFPTGKSEPLIYSTLRPCPAPDGSLHLATTDRRLFNGVVILVIALIGLPLFRQPARRQLILLLVLAALLLLIGIFVPRLARSILLGVFPLAIALLVLIWLVGHVSGWRRPRSPAAGEASSLSTDADSSDRTEATSSAPPPDGPAPTGQEDEQPSRETAEKQGDQDKRAQTDEHAHGHERADQPADDDKDTDRSPEEGGRHDG